jgi:KaiC/GvpD/RAD55 family RecA-like ATPase
MVEKMFKKENGEKIKDLIDYLVNDDIEKEVIKTPFNQFNYFFHGNIHSGDIVLLAGQPNIDLTAFINQLISKNIEQKKSILYLTFKESSKVFF